MKAHTWPPFEIHDTHATLYTIPVRAWNNIGKEEQERIATDIATESFLAADDAMAFAHPHRTVVDMTEKADGPIELDPARDELTFRWVYRFTLRRKSGWPLVAGLFRLAWRKATRRQAR